MKTITIRTCENIQEAYILKGKLENEGVNSFIKNENYFYIKPNPNNIYAYGPQLVINEKDLKQAREILGDKLVEEKEITICPRCGSNNIGLGRNRNVIVRFFVVLMSVLLLIPFGRKKPKLYCRECKTEII